MVGQLRIALRAWLQALTQQENNQQEITRNNTWLIAITEFWYFICGVYHLDLLLLGTTTSGFRPYYTIEKEIATSTEELQNYRGIYYTTEEFLRTTDEFLNYRTIEDYNFLTTEIIVL